MGDGPVPGVEEMVRGLEPRCELVRQANRRDLLKVGHNLPGVLHGECHVWGDLADALVDPLVQPVRTIIAGNIWKNATQMPASIARLT